jgi:Flagellar basal body-associated protein
MTAGTDIIGRKRFPLKAIVGAFMSACVAGAAGFAFYVMEPADDVMRIEGMVSNLSGGGMVKLSLSVVMEHGTAGEGAEDKARDFILGHLRGVSKSQLDGVQGIEGLKAAATEGLRGATGGAVKEVLIREFVVNG